ncbi:hypothetical protein D1B17_08580 [Companilactobacillus zhachilii]|uniref:Uncharacterized protein n=1 Tax=Companilactobacillus zhachilii TaxID=2304606 RepID=A0A386PUP8_9LACO|nr:hypothetical protein [Companilactobacillus zhachilii]AYE38679.1 hypothetical protein D1B17_08580 [Companilactobacillus zhachilii]
MVNKLSQTIIDFDKLDKKNIKTIKIGDKIIRPDENGQAVLNGTSGGDDGGDTGGGTDPNHPAAGADYYAGSLADGEITERYLLYQRNESVAEDPTTSKTVTLLRDVGTKFNMAGDGATFLLHLQKTIMTAGAKGAVSDINLNYDTNNIAKEGYFTTTSVYPVYIKAADLATTNELDVPINGIGENLSGKNVLAPHLKVKFNGDGTMTYYSVTGYDNDGNTAGATGANYDVVVDVIATFSVQPAVAQMPASVNFFTGTARNDIALSGVSDFYENSMDGILLTLNQYVYSSTDFDRAFRSSFGIDSPLRVPKEQLIIGNKIDFKFSEWNIPGTGAAHGIDWYTKNNSGGWSDTGNVIMQSGTDGDFYMIINKDSISFNCYRNALNSNKDLIPFYAKINSINPFKK